jgi:DNA repair exonuclease SbcCD ATPase subunit
MEKFIASLAIRVGLINVSNLPRPNFLAIDEGFGNLDSSNLNSIFRLFDYLKTEFDYIIIISHIDAMRDITDNLIDINTSTGLSNVVHN